MDVIELMHQCSTDQAALHTHLRLAPVRVRESEAIILSTRVPGGTWGEPRITNVTHLYYDGTKLDSMISSLLAIRDSAPEQVHPMAISCLENAEKSLFPFAGWLYPTHHARVALVRACLWGCAPTNDGQRTRLGFTVDGLELTA